VVEDQVRLIDVMPTLLSLAGIERQPASQGRSLVPLCLGEELPPEPALCELLVDLRGLRALRERDWKYIEPERYDQRGGVHLAKDPAERTLIQDLSVVGQGLSRLQAELARAVDFGAREVGQGTQRVDVPAGIEDALRALGYTDTSE
jgi:arylsulfatase A-like enzyme